MNVLLIEDNPQNIENIKAMLAGHDITVLTEVTNQFYQDESLAFNEQLNLGSYDLVVTDVNLPAYTDKGIMEGPIGLIIAFKALQRGAKKIAVITNSNHHEANPISKGFDMFETFSGLYDGAFFLGDSKIFFVNCPKKELYLKDRLAWLISDTKETYLDFIKQ